MEAGLGASPADVVLHASHKCQWAQRVTWLTSAFYLNRIGGGLSMGGGL
jgi:hypothetical protein